MDLLVATRSAHKLREIRQILAPLPQLRPLDLGDAGVPPDPAEEHIESFDTFAANALAKGRYFADRTGLLTIADDSGICVDALDGAPGVRSKRFSGRSDLSGEALDEANNRLLLELLGGAENRSAHYVCAAALVDPASGREHTVIGRCDGVILQEPAGSGGFGYDPLFFLPEYHATFGELPPETKNLVSHRGRAFRAAADVLSQWFPAGAPPAG